MYLYLFLTSFVPCFGADSKICSNLLKRKQTVSNPVLVLKTFAMLRTPLSFLFQGHCLRQGNFHYASRDAGTTWDAWVSTAVTRRTAVEPMSLLAITTCRSQCSSSLEILLYAAVQYDPREVKKLHGDDIGMIPWETNLAPNYNCDHENVRKKSTVNKHLQKISKRMWSIQNRIFSI